MKAQIALIFFSIVSLIYILLNWLLLSRGLKAFNPGSSRTWFIVGYSILAFTFIAGQIIERGAPGYFGKLISQIGSVWLAVFFYSLLFVLVVDVVRLLNFWFDFIPNDWKTTFLSAKSLFILCLVIVFSLVSFGFFNAMNPITNKIDIRISKSSLSDKELKVVFVSDVHIGAVLGKNRLKGLIQRINAQDPDVVLFGGDLVDHNPYFLTHSDMGKEFLKLNARLGVFAVAGNHEFIGNVDVSIDYLSKFGVKYLRDTSIILNNELVLAGRDDIDKARFVGEPRKQLENILNTNDSLPIILIDHQPVDYDKAEKLGVDLMLSGHTHKGQLWPFGYVTAKIYKNDYGLMQKSTTHFYTSSGYGTWGPPVRIGNKPELVVFSIKGK